MYLVGRDMRTPFHTGAVGAGREAGEGVRRGRTLFNTMTCNELCQLPLWGWPDWPSSGLGSWATRTQQHREAGKGGVLPALRGEAPHPGLSQDLSLDVNTTLRQK